MGKSMRCFFENPRGSLIIEYAVILGLLALAVAFFVKMPTSSIYSKVADAFFGETSVEVPSDTPGEPQGGSDGTNTDGNEILNPNSANYLYNDDLYNAIDNATDDNGLWQSTTHLQQLIQAANSVDAELVWKLSEYYNDIVYKIDEVRALGMAYKAGVEDELADYVRNGPLDALEALVKKINEVTSHILVLSLESGAYEFNENTSGRIIGKLGVICEELEAIMSKSWENTYQTKWDALPWTWDVEEQPSS
jgi:Flp pilus assembly pilin Flp